MKRETNFQVAVEKTLIRKKEGDTMDCYEYNDQVLKPKFNQIRIDVVKHILDLKYSQFKEYLEDYTEIGYDSFDNYDEYSCDFIKCEVYEYIAKKIEETEYTQEVMDGWDD